LRTAATEIVIDMGRMMIDDDNHSSNLMRFRGFPEDTGFL